MAKKSNSINFVFSKQQFQSFLNKIKELTKIDTKIYLKLNKENIILYSTVGSGKQIYVFQNYIFKTSDILTLKDELPDEIIFIIKDNKKVHRNLTHYLDDDFDIKCEMEYSTVNDKLYSDIIRFDNSILSLSISGGDPFGPGTNSAITIEQIKKYLDTKHALFDFDLNKEMFTRIKKMTTVEIEHDVLSITVKSNKLTIGENKWLIRLCDINQEDSKFTFPKKYFNTLNVDTNIKIFVFETYLLFKNSETDLLVSLES